MQIATNIKTELWNEIIQQLVNDDWKPTYTYDNFDAGIDADFVILEKDKEEILFGWDNWFEGEIACSAERMEAIEQMMDHTFIYGEPVNLKPEVIALHRKWQRANLFKRLGFNRKRRG